MFVPPPSLEHEERKKEFVFVCINKIFDIDHTEKFLFVDSLIFLSSTLIKLYYQLY